MMSPEIRRRMEAARAAGDEATNHRRDPYIVLTGCLPFTGRMAPKSSDLLTA